jgi:hypothetical protein
MKMTAIEKNTEQNIDLAFDFIRHLLGNPDLIDDIPNGSTVRFKANNQALADFPKDHTEKTYWVNFKQTFELP